MDRTPEVKTISRKLAQLASAGRAAQLGEAISAHHIWVRKAEAAELPVEPVDAEARIRQLEQDNRELRKSNEILKSAAAYFGKAEFDRLHR